MNVFFFVFLTVFSTVVSQILFKYGVRDLVFTHSLTSIQTLLNGYVLGGLLFSLVSIVSWLLALSKLSLGQAYPFMSLSFPLVLVFSMYLFGEQISMLRWIGIALIVSGLIVMRNS
jgi:multidrug transporter EmrE-like cation transporter